MRSSKKSWIVIAVAVACGVLAAVLVVLQIEKALLPPSPSVSWPESSLPASRPAPESEPAPAQIRYIEQAELELPVEGATGYTIVDTELWPEPAAAGEAAWLPPGASFAVVQESGEWWQVQGEGVSGWVVSAKCMINLPDVVPSIVYDDTNSYSSVFLTCGKPIPGITGAALYNAQSYNERLGREEFVMPVLYPMAKRICAAQQAALAEGNTLVIIEAYRPWTAQQAVVQAITALAETDEEVKEAISAPPWGTDWFIATGVSNHQQGYAVDLTLARADAREDVSCGLYDYTRVSAHTRYDMQTPIHELSPASASMAGPIDPRSADWRAMAPAPGMNESALLLQRYCTGAGLTPLASEWWHFNDYQALDAAGVHGGGNFTVGACHSFVPEAL